MIEKLLFRCLLMLAITVVVSGCAFSRLADDLEQLEAVTHVFAGTVSARGIESNSVVVIALRDQQGSQIAGFRVATNSGLFEFKSTPQPLWLFAFNDQNRDFAFQADEPSGWANAGRPADPGIAATDQLTIEIVVASDNLSPVPVNVINTPLLGHISDIAQLHSGTVKPLNDPIFLEEYAKKGLLQPFEFFADGAAGIFFMEEYDPKRIPVLFVHGISDTPRRFTALIESLNHAKYQAWVFSYPSGLPLPVSSKGMYQFLNLLEREHQFEQLHIVAHSMGGLVSRGWLNSCVQDHACDYLRSYTTISTPWNGVASAKDGAKWLSTPMLNETAVDIEPPPVWSDLDPDSDYMTTLFDSPIPEGVPHNLIFGFRQDSLFGLESSDGVIKLSSQLRMEAQEQASQVRGYDEDHVSILTNESVIAQVNQILDANSQKK